MTVLVEAIGVTKHFPVRAGRMFRRTTLALRAVDDVALRIEAGETLGLVGESGCGKSTLGRLLIRLIEPSSGAILFDGKDISDLAGKALRDQRRAMQIIFQDPFGALNPRMTVEDIIAWWGCRSGRATAIRTSSPAGSASASGLRGRWCCGRASWCATSRCPRWMFRCRHRSSICCRICRLSWG